MADYTSSRVIHLCVNCGNYCGGKYCNYCTTKEKRALLAEQQEVINKEMEARGVKVERKITYEPIDEEDSSR